MIRIERVSKKFGKQQVLNSIDLECAAGQSVALIGPNGSGKTSLIKSILGLVIPDSGDIFVKGQTIAANPDYRKAIGYMPQLSQFPEQMRVHQLFTLIRQFRKDVAPTGFDLQLFDEFQLHRFSNKALGTLSGGMKQQVSAALAFYCKPDIIILDEPTAGLDPMSNEILKNKVRDELSRNRLLITTSHILNDLEEICNHVVYLMDGKVVLDERISVVAESTGEVKLNKMVVNFLENTK